LKWKFACSLEISGTPTPKYKSLDCNEHYKFVNNKLKKLLSIRSEL